MINDNEEDSELGIDQIKEAVLKLSASDSVTFRDWFNELDAKAWDEQFESDVAEGRLVALANEALEEVRLGSSTER